MLNFFNNFSFIFSTKLNFTLILLNVIMNLIKELIIYINFFKKQSSYAEFKRGLITMNQLPLWITELDESELNFIKNFVLSSGSLKQMAKEYEVTYPTIRSHLDAVIKKIELGEQSEEDPYVKLIKGMVIEGSIEFDAAAVLIREYKNSKQ